MTRLKTMTKNPPETVRITIFRTLDSAYKNEVYNASTQNTPIRELTASISIVDTPFVGPLSLLTVETGSFSPCFRRCKFAMVAQALDKNKGNALSRD